MSQLSESKVRKTKMIYKPWTVDRIFHCADHELKAREIELAKLHQRVQSELLLAHGTG